MSLSAEFIQELRKNIRGPVRTDRSARVLYSTDASIYQIEPLGVVIPRDQDDLQAAVELAARHAIPILPRGSGSSLAGQAIGPALILDCSRWLDRILEIDPEGRTAVVEPGVILASLNKALESHGLQFGPDPASAERATLGGVIANNATGAHSILYGMAADHLKQADVILSDGTRTTWGEMHRDSSPLAAQNERMKAIVFSLERIRRETAESIKAHYPKTWRNSAGYRLNYLLPWSPSSPPGWEREFYPPTGAKTINLAPLLAGSEGTLAVISRATLNLVPKPRHAVLAVMGYESIGLACDDVPRLLSFAPSAIELIPRSLVRLAKSVPAYASQAAILDLEAEALLVVEFSGENPAELIRAAHALHPALVAASREDQSRIWNVRKVGLGLLASRSGDAKTVAFIEDCAIPVERLGEFVRGLAMILHDHGVRAEYYAHASAGCLHIRPILDLKRNVAALRGIAKATLDLTLSLGGSMSSEHGDGLARSEWLLRTYGKEVFQAFHSLKEAADPRGILNPGKILDAPAMDSNLRFGGSYRARGWTSGLDFSDAGGPEGAIEQCNGQGVCRKFDGTMCPSFQATREEINSTRGRANLLRAMISQGMGEELAASAHEALDLCLACKGCKSECPSGVDMASLKFSFEAEYYKTHRRKLRDYLFGYFHTVSALLAPVAPVANALMRYPPSRRVIAGLAGISLQRPFPVYSRHHARVQAQKNSGDLPTVLFLPDAFTHFIEAEVEQAAFNLLGAAGFRITKLPVIGAGAALLSKGFVEPARRHATRLLDSILRLDPKGKHPILGLEPPETYLLKHEMGSLLPDRKDEVLAVAERTWSIEEFLIRSESLGALRVAISARVDAQAKETRLRFQPHCHQRAEPPSSDGLPSGTNSTVALLRSCGFANIEVINAGCCGMAGTFGYEAEHYDLSMKVGGLKLFPYIEESSKDDPAIRFLASGSACRLQVEQGTRVSAEHPLVFLSRYL